MNDPNGIIKSETDILDLGTPPDLRPFQPNAGYPSGGYQPDSEEGEGVHLRDYWRAIRKRLWLVVGIVVLVTLLAAIYMAREPDIYVAQARVQVDLETAGPSVGNAKNQAVIINNPVSDPTYFNTQLQILSSPGMLRRVVKTLDLEHNRTFRQAGTSGERSSWRGLLRVLGLAGKDQGGGAGAADREELALTTTVAPAVSREDLAEAKRLSPYVKSLQGSLKVEPVKETRTAGYIKDTRLIDISFRHADPQVAAKIVNAVADTFVYQNLEKKNETNTSTGSFLQERVADLQNKIRTGEEQLANYAKNHQILQLNGDQNIVVDRLSGLNRQLLEAENDRKMSEAAYRAASAPQAAEALADGSTRLITDTQAKLDELRQKRAELAVRYTDKHPELLSTDRQIAELENQLKQNRGRAVETATTNLETRYRQSLAREQSLRAALDRQRGETLNQNDAAISYRILQQEIETNKNLLDGLLQRSRENDVVLVGMPNNISVTDYALSPDFPVGPKRRQGVMLALLLSTAFGVGLALFLEYLNDTVRSSDEVETLLRLPTLSVIPTVTASGVGRMLPGVGSLQRWGGGRAGEGNGNHPELLLNAEINSPLAEAYRHLRTSVLLSRAGQPPRTLLITSSLPAEGKTTTSVNTALSLEQTGASVVVVDADLRRPRLHKVFGEELGNGLSTILSSELGADEMLALVRHHEATNLHLLTSGPVSPNPAELLGSEQMRRLVAALQARYKYVVIDSPPIVPFTDSVLISKMVDGVLLVVQGGKTSHSIARRSKQILNKVGARILGVVLNNVTINREDYYYHQHYHPYYAAEKSADDLAVGAGS